MITKKTELQQQCTNALLPVRDALEVLSGNWKLPILITLASGGKRFKEISRELNGITDKMLSKELKDLETNALVLRTVHETFPPKVEYTLTEHSLSYRMIGEVAVSEDIVQDVVSEWATGQWPEIQNVPAYLSKAVTNRCLNHLSSVKRQRELYKGTWLPEPVVSDEIRRFEAGIDISYGFLMLLGKLTPSERAVFLLRESFDMDYQELAEMLKINEANCRQLFLRAKDRVAGGKVKFVPNWASHQTLLETFGTASRTGDVSSLVDLLNEEIMLYTDGGGKVSAATKPIGGVGYVSRFIEGLAQKGLFHREFLPVLVNGELGILIKSKETGINEAVLIMEMRGEQIGSFYIVLNPEKLP